APDANVPVPAPVVLNSDKNTTAQKPAVVTIPAPAATPTQETTTPAAAPNVSGAPVLNSDKVTTGTAESGETPIINDFSSDAKQAILVDFNTDTVLYEKNSDERMFPSSMTKILTMYLVFDQLKKNHITMDTVYTISEKSWKTGGSQMFLKVGDQ